MTGILACLIGISIFLWRACNPVFFMNSSEARVRTDGNCGGTFPCGVKGMKRALPGGELRECEDPTEEIALIFKRVE
jgi:hypothetical protein